MAKQLNTRIRHKYDSKANWDKATTLKPLEGELIIYSDGAEGGGTTPAIKVGDGSSYLKDLKFIEGVSNTAALPKVKVKFYYYSATKTQNNSGELIPFGKYKDKQYIYSEINHTLENKKDKLTVDASVDYDAVWTLEEYAGVLGNVVKNKITTTNLTSPTCTVGKVPTDNTNDWYIYEPVVADIYNVEGIAANSEITWHLDSPASSYSTVLCQGYAVVYRTGANEDEYKYSLYKPTVDSNTVGKIRRQYILSASNNNTFTSINIIPTVVDDALKVKITVTNNAGSTLTNIGDSTTKLNTPVRGKISEDGNDFVVELYTLVETDAFYGSLENEENFKYFDTYYPEGGDNPCLIEGTLITMADGTQKPIEDVRNGDIVLSYDPNTKEQVPTAVIYAIKTGDAQVFDTYSFTDGSVITAYGLHGIYNARIGYCMDIRKLTRTANILNQDNKLCKITLISKRAYYGLPKARYTLYTTNNLYYANNILMGNSAYIKVERLKTHNMLKYIPETILSSWLEDCEEYNSRTAYRNDTKFQLEAKDVLSTIALATSKIKINKDKLSKTDYKVNKFSEGVLSELEFKESKLQREDYRKIINEEETKLKIAQEEYNKMILTYQNNKTLKDVFNSCCKRDNELFEIIKKHIDEKGYIVPTFKFIDGKAKVIK